MKLEGYEFLNHGDDLVALDCHGEDKGWLQRFIGRKVAAWYLMRPRDKVNSTFRVNFHFVIGLYSCYLFITGLRVG